jgi:uncharacterized RDD family membrane protein YckC
MESNPYEAPKEAGYHTPPPVRTYDGSLGMALLSMGVGLVAIFIYGKIMDEIGRPSWLGEYAGVLWLFGGIACFAGGTLAAWIPMTAIAKAQKKKMVDR